MDFSDTFKYSYDGKLLDTDCRTELPGGGGGGGGGAPAPAVWLVVVQQEGDYLAKVVCAVRTKAAAEGRAAAHAAAHENDRGQTFVTGFRVETGAAPAVFVASTAIQVGHMIDAVTEVKATATAKKQASKLEAIMHGLGGECECVVTRYEVTG
jgi:hypothetical protein